MGEGRATEATGREKRGRGGRWVQRSVGFGFRLGIGLVFGFQIRVWVRIRV